jgi:hypothetical protein
MTGMDQPALTSLALRDIPAPDFADVTLVPVPPGAPEDPAVWAAEIFSLRSGPRWIVALLALRQLVVGAIGVQRADPTVFKVREVVGEEALVGSDDRHLDFRAAVGLDPVARLVRVTTTVRLHGWRGRVYFAPVRLLHPPVVLSMTRAAVRRLTR